MKDFILNVDDGSYLVEVEWNAGEPGVHGIQDLPVWIFQSRYAIWLTAGSAPIRVRALEGEQIRQQLFSRFSIV